MRYTIAKEKEVRKLAAEGKSSNYISSVTDVSEKVIWSWCPETRPHDDVIKWSVKQRFHSVFPEYEAKISSAIAPLLKPTISDEEWEKVNGIIYSTLFDEAIVVFKNFLEEPPEFGSEKKLSKQPLLEYLKDFWKEGSEYVIENELKPSYVTMCRNSIHYWSMLRKFNLSEVNKGDLERVYEYLVKKNLSQSRINSIMKVALIPLKNAYKKGLILNRCFDFLLPKKTDDKMYLSNSQIVKIFNSDWNDTEAFLANLIAYECKMQLQEVRALRLIDIKTNEIIVNNCYSNSKGLIPCDNKRAVNISSLLNFAILKYLSTAPYSDFKPEDYVFYSEQRDRPAHAKFWTKELQTICKKKLHIKKPVDFRIWSRVN